VTAAAAFAVQQTIDEYPQVTAHYVPSGGYFPLSGWAGFAVLRGYATVVLGLALYSVRRRSTASQPQAQWRWQPNCRT
jgi:hypothetical protein